MRLITRLDLDGIISAVMISAVDRIEEINFANPSDIENRMVEIDEILEMGPVKKRVERYFRDEERFKEELTHYTNVVDGIIVTDFRDFSDPPHGNRFFVFAQYPEGTVHVRMDTIDIMRVKASVSKSIFNRSCTTHIGQLMEEFGGGGVAGAGTCMLNKRTVDDRIQQIIDRLK